MVPVPRVASWEELNAHLREECRKRRERKLWGQSSLYVEDVARSARFYEKIFGFRIISDFGDCGCAMEAGRHQVLLLFNKRGSRAVQTPHYGDGELHVAFAIRAEELLAWENWLAINGIVVEEKRRRR